MNSKTKIFRNKFDMKYVIPPHENCKTFLKEIKKYLHKWRERDHVH